jgi:hypothetical protein
MHLEDALRHREIRRADLYRQFELAAFASAAVPGGRPQRARPARGQLMHPVRRRASDNLFVPVEPTALLYKEVPELPRQPWSEQPAASPGLFHLGLGETTRILPAAECGASW